MKLLLVAAFFLILASVSTLVSGGEGGRLVQQSWFEASHPLPAKRMSELGSVMRAYTERVFQLVPVRLRQKFGQKLWDAIELMMLRLVTIRYVAPTFVLSAWIGLLEGFWSRSNLKGLVKIHSPMRFNLGLVGLGASTAMTMLWVTAPIAVPVFLVVFCVFALAVLSIRSLVVHTPSQF